jgi:hypothetical protein
MEGAGHEPVAVTYGLYGRQSQAGRSSSRRVDEEQLGGRVVEDDEEVVGGVNAVPAGDHLGRSRVLATSTAAEPVSFTLRSRTSVPAPMSTLIARRAMSSSTS